MTADHWLQERAQVSEREGDPERYRDPFGRWVRKTQWTIENYPGPDDWDAFSRFIQETTRTERAELRAAYMRSNGLVPWHDLWVTPETAQELEERYRENRRKEQENVRQAREMKRFLRHWPGC